MLRLYPEIRSLPQQSRVKFIESADFYPPESARGESRRERLTELVITFAIDSEKYVELKVKLSRGYIPGV